ncbi:MAG: patatin-like phospholipase family protein [Bacteroidota bacterium]|nr:patatin-like phospholipase family protein [Bacteroidota bacterium]
MKSGLILIFFLPLFIFSQNKFDYKNLVMEGGGVRGLAYSGALEVLEQKGILKNIDCVAGSSVGAIAGLMVSIGYNSKEIDSILQILKVQQFNDGKDIFGKIKRVRREYGVYKGDKFQKWLGELIDQKTGNSQTTLEELHQLHLSNKNFKDFYCTGTNISQQRLDILSWKTMPRMKLSTAVHISSCIPFYFIPVGVDSAGNEVNLMDSLIKHDLYVDGGMLCNYPINMFDSCVEGNNPLTCENVIYNPQTLGLKLERGAQIDSFEKNDTAIAPYQIKSMKQYISAVVNLGMETINRKPGLENEKGRTIYISYGDISGRPRKVSLKEKKMLHDNGIVAANKFFNEPVVVK